MLKTLKKIAFERVGGSPEEKKVFDILAEEVKSRGIEPVLESFEVDTFRSGEGHVEINGKSFAANPVGLTGNADITGALRYIEPTTLPLAEDADGQIVLLSGGVNYEKYKKLAELDVAGFLIVTRPGKKAGFPAIKKKAITDFGKIPGAVISYEAGRVLIQSGNIPARLVTDQKEYKGTSHNLLATIPGEIDDEDILICAHADSVADSPGAIDNAAGCVELLGLLGHFAKNKPRRTLRFCFFGSEELGLLGSHEYVKKHSDELESIRLVINLDLGGDIFGDNQAIITGPKEIETYIDSNSKLHGLGLHVKSDVYSSDNMPFARKGIPSVSFARVGLGSSLGHSCEDDIRNVDEKSLRDMANIALDFADKMVNARVFPFERQIPDDIGEKVEKYFKERQGLGIKD